MMRKTGNGRPHPPRLPRCSVVIRAYNEEAHIGRLLVGILHQTVRDVEIVLVDSGSTDATLAIASRYPVRLVHIEPGSFSFGRSLNAGCAKARGEFIVIASAHVYPVYADWLAQLLRPFRDPAVALAYGRQRGGATTRFSEQRVFEQWFGDVSVPDQDSPFCNNANAAIRRSHWQRRPYNEELPGLEDVEWATRARSAGHRIAYRAEAEVIHLHDETPRAVFNRYRREAMALKRIRPEEHFGLRELLPLFLSHVSLDLKAALRQGVARRAWNETLWFRWMQFWGTYRGFSTAGPLTGQLKEAFYYPARPAEPAAARSRRRPPLDYAVLAEGERRSKIGARRRIRS